MTLSRSQSSVPRTPVARWPRSWAHPATPAEGPGRTIDGKSEGDQRRGRADPRHQRALVRQTRPFDSQLRCRGPPWSGDAAIVRHRPVTTGATGRTTQRNPTCDVDVSTGSGKARRRTIALAVVRRAQVRAALQHLRGIRTPAARGRSSRALAPPRGLRGMQHALDAHRSDVRARYQSVVHSQTLPIMSNSP